MELLPYFQEVHNEDSNEKKTEAVAKLYVTKSHTILFRHVRQSYEDSMKSKIFVLLFAILVVE